MLSTKNERKFAIWSHGLLSSCVKQFQVLVCCAHGRELHTQALWSTSLQLASLFNFPFHIIARNDWCLLISQFSCQRLATSFDRNSCWGDRATCLPPEVLFARFGGVFILLWRLCFSSVTRYRLQIEAELSTHEIFEVYWVFSRTLGISRNAFHVSEVWRCVVIEKQCIPFLRKKTPSVRIKKPTLCKSSQGLRYQYIGLSRFELRPAHASSNSIHSYIFIWKCLRMFCPANTSRFGYRDVLFIVRAVGSKARRACSIDCDLLLRSGRYTLGHMHLKVFDNALSPRIQIALGVASFVLLCISIQCSPWTFQPTIDCVPVTAIWRIYMMIWPHTLCHLRLSWDTQ